MKNDHTTLIKERLSITDVVGSYVRLEKSGRNYRACCPFHTEKTPSFFVVPEKNIFHCFGCGKGGDIFTFVEDMESLDFPAALKLLAERAGVTLDARAIQEKGKHDRLYKALELATRFFEVNLRKDTEIVEYLLSRGLTKETIVKFRIGYARDDWRGLSDRLHESGITDTELVATGLSIQKDNRVFDRFRNRIMFPLADSQGRIVGFSGRVFDSRKGATEMAKYMNSPETALYHKGTMLYGFDVAKRAMRDSNTCLMVEGQFDVVLAHQAGTTNTVALSGTGLSAEHCNLIKRFADNLVLALDGDEAGIRASRRSVLLALQQGLSVSVLPLPPKDDPASIIARSTEEWTTLVANQTRPVLELELSLLQSVEKDMRQSAVHEQLFPLIRAQGSSLSQDQSLMQVAHELSASPDALRKEFSIWLTANPDAGAVQTSRQPAARQAVPATIKLIGLTALLQEKYPSLYDDISQQFARFTTGDTLPQLLERHTEQLPEYSFIAEHEYGDDQEHIRRVALELLVLMEQSQIEAELEELLPQMRAAERDGREEEHQALLQAVTVAHARLKDLKSQRSIH